MTEYVLLLIAIALDFRP